MLCFAGLTPHGLLLELGREGNVVVVFLSPLSLCGTTQMWGMLTFRGGGGLEEDQLSWHF